MSTTATVVSTYQRSIAMLIPRRETVDRGAVDSENSPPLERVTTALGRLHQLQQPEWQSNAVSSESCTDASVTTAARAPRVAPESKQQHWCQQQVRTLHHLAAHITSQHHTSPIASHCIAPQP
jgi:hypothetical protein